MADLRLDDPHAGDDADVRSLARGAGEGDLECAERLVAVLRRIRGVHGAEDVLASVLAALDDEAREARGRSMTPAFAQAERCHGLAMSLATDPAASSAWRLTEVQKLRSRAESLARELREREAANYL